MKSLKILSIIGLILFPLSFLCVVGFGNSYDWEASVGWGIYATLYGIAFAIVGLVKSKKK